MKKRIVISAIAAAALISAPAQINNPSTEGYYSRALHMYQDKNYNGCIDQMSHLLELNPTPQQREDADYYIAMSSMAKGESNAIELLNKFLENYPASLHRMDVVNAKGDYYFSREQYAIALSEYKLVDVEALLDPKKEDYTYRKSYCYLKLTDYADAEAGFKNLCSTKKYGNSAKFYCGYIAYVKSNYNEALSYFSQVDPKSELGDMTNYYKSQIYFFREDYAKAQSEASKLLNKDVDALYIAEANRIVGESLYNQGDVVGAIPYLKKYISSVEEPLPTSRYILGVCQYKNQEYSQAIENLEYATGLDNEMGQGAYLMIGQAMLKQGNVQAAMMALEKAMKMSHNIEMQEIAFYNYAVASMQGGSIPFGSSVANFEEFLRRYPESSYAPKVQEYIVTGYMTDKNYERALASIEAINNPNDKILGAKQRVLYSLGVKEYNLGNESQAITRFIQSKELASYDANLARETELWLGNCYYNQDNYVGAIDAYNSYLEALGDEESDNLPLVYYNLAYSYFQNKQYDEAVNIFNKFVGNPKNIESRVVADAYCRIADCQYMKKDFSAAMKSYEKAYNTNVKEGDYALYQQAMMQGNIKDINGKIKTLNNVVDLYPSSSIMPMVLLELAESYVEKNDYNKAIATYKRLVSKYPSTAQGRNGCLQLAVAYVNNGEKDKAIETYKSVIMNYATSSEARLASRNLMDLYAADNNLDLYTAFMSTVPGAQPIDHSELEEAAYFAAETVYNEKADIEQLREYVVKYPKSTYVPSALALLIEYENENGNYEQALEYAEELITRFPDNEAVEYALMIKADLEYDNNQKELALADYERLEERASTSQACNDARLGVLRAAFDLAKYDLVVKKADQLLGAQLGSELNAEVLYKKAYSLNKLNRSSEAVEIWSQLKDNVEIIYGSMSAVELAQYYFDNNNLEESRRIIEAFVESPTPFNYWLARGYILISDISRKEGRIFEANEYLRTLRSNYPGSEQDIFNLIDERLK